MEEGVRYAKQRRQFGVPLSKHQAVHSIVCIKSVMRAAPDGAGRRAPDNSELNPFDRPGGAPNRCLVVLYTV
ncbi:MAG: hypothetical protein ACQET7_13365 [Thermodesulfobacteriota bacterium]